MRRYKKNTNGFTLVEMIVYVAFISVFSVVIMGVFVTTLKVFADFRLTRDINESAIAVMERLVREIRIAYEVDQVESTLGTNPGILHLKTTTVTGTSTTVEFYATSSRVRMEEGGVDAGYLSSQNVNVDLLIFDLITNTNTEAVTIRMQLSATRGSVTKTKSFYSTAILRGSY